MRSGMPGVLSARWAGKPGDDDANLELRVGQLARRPERGAAFVCAAALVLPDGQRGRPGAARRDLPTRRRGATVSATTRYSSPPATTTTAQIAAAEKDAISHRGRAFRAIAPLIAARA